MAQPHLARALLEGCAFAMRDVADRLRDMGAEIRSLLLLGGGARSRLWAQMRADIMGLPALVPHRVDTSPVGAAMLAGVAAGLVENLRAAAELVQEPVAPLAPVPANRDAYERCLREISAALRLAQADVRPGGIADCDAPGETAGREAGAR